MSWVRFYPSPNGEGPGWSSSYYYIDNQLYRFYAKQICDD